MPAIVVYKSKYGSTKKYAEWISEELNCPVYDVKNVKVTDLKQYDTVIYGGGLYAEVIAGVNLITKNLNKLEGKKIVVFTTGMTPVDYREYYDEMVAEKNFDKEMLSKIKIFNFPGKMIIDELSVPHKAALKMLKKMMSSKENPTDGEKLLLKLCDESVDLTERDAIDDLIAYVNKS